MPSESAVSYHDGANPRRCGATTCRMLRKRAPACFGVRLVAASHLMSFMIVRVHASSLFQHHVGAAHRQVSYRHLVEGRPRDLSSKFWVSGVSDVSMEGNKHENARVLEVVNDDPEQVVWSIVADATYQRPLGTHEILSEDEKEEASQERFLRRNPRRRREQVKDKFVEDSTSATLQDGGSDGDEHGEEKRGSYVQDESDSNIHENYAGYNVTAEVIYNVSMPEYETDNNTLKGGRSYSVLTSSSKLPDNSSSAFTPYYQPLRIRAVISEQRDGGDYLTVLGRRVLLHDIIRPALLTWSAALRVEPVLGNLTVDKHQLFDNQTCGPGMDSGLPSPRVPSYHFTHGIPDTDMILYVSIGFVPGVFKNWTRFIRNATIPIPSEDYNAASDAAEANSERSPTKSQRMGDNRELGASSQDGNDWRGSAATTPASGPTSEPEGGDRTPEMSDAPMPAVNPEPQLYRPSMCAGDYVGAASYCSTDQYDRPTAGMLHICIDDTFFSNSTRNKQIVTIMHEVGHALGFNARSMAHFRRPDGSPITPRVNGQVVETMVECTGPSSNRRSANVTLPSQEILQFRTVRGGVRVAEVVTPSVLQVVRNRFGCQNLSGAELESGEYSPLSGEPEKDSCIGDHWERRLFQNDIMNPVVDGVEYSPYISTITLAYFADSGWYQVDLSMAELAASWGRGAGCGFVEDTCIGEDGTVPPSNRPFFCTAVPKRTSKGLVQEIDGCTADLYRKAACSLGQYDTELPQEYQYFGSLYDGTVGGSDPYIDYCPTYTGFDNGLCSSPDSAAILKVAGIERFGYRNSRCLSGLVDARTTALCLPIACVVEDRSLHVKLDGTWRLCEYKDQELKVAEDQHVVCPDPRRVCPTFYCHHDCLGTAGWCNYDTGACVCNRLGGTNATLAMPGDNSTNVTGACRRRQSSNSFSPGGRRNRTLIEMPHADSPLSDYYVPFKESLRDDQMRLLTTLQLVVLILFLLLIASALFWYFRLWGNWEGASESNDNYGRSEAVNPNKHKMIATVLVDMRINAPDAASVAPTAETASSLCGLESAASVDSVLCSSSLENDERSSLASEEIFTKPDVLHTKPKCSVRKRRFNGRFIREIGRD